jgi:hypothetical protein
MITPSRSSTPLRATPQQMADADPASDAPSHSWPCTIDDVDARARGGRRVRRWNFNGEPAIQTAQLQRGGVRPSHLLDDSEELEGGLHVPPAVVDLLTGR